MKANRLRLEAVSNGWIFVATYVAPNNKEGELKQRMVFASLEEALDYIGKFYKEKP